MNELETKIHLLIQETCQHPQGSLERKKGLNQIILQIQQSGKLFGGYYMYNYAEALQETWGFFCRHFCRFDPDKATVFTWLNNHLKYRLKDEWEEYIKHQKNCIPPIIKDNGEVIDPLESLIARPEPPPILEEIHQWLHQQEAQLRRVHVRGRPDINCYVLIQQRLPPEISWSVLAPEYGVAIATLSNFYQRECFPRLLNFGKSQDYI
jgi:hypothetical protein